MSIKSDKWIRRMAVEHRMIDPFAPEQVRSAAGQKIVSYGTSSYGYDVRCAREFKIFTNINSTIVDPKAFDPKSFVDLESDVCIIPPNSFALARTVEYFRIPRTTLVVCLGKCVTGDTRVVDADTGAYLPITEMRWGRKTLALDGWELRPAAVSAFVPQGRREVFELRTRAGLRIRATANHPFRAPGGWTPLERLKAGDRIAVARSIPVFGRMPIPDWEATLLGLMISEGQCPASGPSPTVPGADPVLVSLLRSSLDASGLGADGLQGWRKQYGLDVAAEERCVPQTIFMAPREGTKRFLQALFGADGGLCHTGGKVCLEYFSQSRRLLEDIHHLLLRFGVVSLIREDTTAIGTRAGSIQITDPKQIERFAQCIGYPEGSLKQRGLELQILPLIRFDASTEDRPVMAAAGGSGGVSLNSHGVTTDPAHSLPCAEASRVALRSRAPEPASLIDGPLWDVISEIIPAGTEEVFDISVPRVQNFLANGIVVHNSTYARVGIVVNVTPLEPEWEGHVTLEFSNTTPLPAKIYANEGVAQMLFFESDEVCETSYKDRGGKYQGQTGVTLPKT